MRKANLLLSATLMAGAISGAGAANAADMAIKAPPPVAVYHWTGCYIGVEGGGQWGNARSVGTGLRNGVRVGPGGNLKNQTDFDGGLGGGTLGCNYEVNRWVLGIEGDGSWSSISGSSSLVPPVFNPNFREAFGNHWLATVRGRVGYAVREDVLLYGTAGGAFADLRVNEFNVGNVISITDTHTFSGWTAGAGVEWGFAPAWSAKVEYLYLDLGAKNYFAFTTAGFIMQSTHLIDNVVRVGVNYRFNWAGPVVAKY
jgi:outer membrane immunogenic protein